jgi:hypothetical protein
VTKGTVKFKPDAADDSIKIKGMFNLMGAPIDPLTEDVTFGFGKPARSSTSGSFRAATSR